MAITITSPITGAAQTGFTTPGYVVTADTAPPGNPGRQVAVTGLSGTQTGVTTHSVASPFTGNITRPASPRTLGNPNPVTGVVSNVPKNTYKVITRKGVTILAGQPIQVMTIVTYADIPAGADLADPSNVRGGLSFHFGLVAQQSAGFGDTTVSGIL